ncbi:MAG: hypothetical protein WCY28_01940 [Candidatus Shapirobacteria bacterium]|jgi:hypothetical protein
MPKTIRLISVDKKLKKYLRDFNADYLEKLSLDQGNQFFVKIIKDFKEGNLTLDELSVFGNNIFHAIGKKHEKSDLFSTSLSTAELNFMIRNSYLDIPNYLKDIDDFFDKYNIKK